VPRGIRRGEVTYKKKSSIGVTITEYLVQHRGEKKRSISKILQKKDKFLGTLLISQVKPRREKLRGVWARKKKVFAAKEKNR